MTIVQILGALLLASPFAGIFVIAVRDLGVREALGIFGVTLAIVAIIMVGTFMLLGTS